MYSIATLSSKSGVSSIVQRQSSNLPIDVEPTMDWARPFVQHNPWHYFSPIFDEAISNGW
jgi:hypothetical protein